MDIRQLRTILAIAETGSLTRAAELLHVVQPALSRQLRQLEDELGATLFERNRLGMVLTEPGRRFVDQVRVSLQGLYQAKADIGAAAENLMGSVSIGMLPGLGAALAGPLVLSLRRQYPDLKVRILTGFTDVLQDGLERGKIDICLMGDYLQSTLLHTEPVYREPLYVVGLAGTGLEPSMPWTLAEVAKLPLVIPEAKSLRNVIDRACTIIGVDLNLVAESDSTSIVIQLVESGVGYTILPVMPIRPALQAGKLVGAPIVSPTLRRTIKLCSPVIAHDQHVINVLRGELLGMLRPFVASFSALGVEWLLDEGEELARR
ncbi:MAG: LysR family transcriptional regulator [Comamonas sp.]